MVILRKGGSQVFNFPERKQLRNNLVVKTSKQFFLETFGNPFLEGLGWIKGIKVVGIIFGRGWALVSLGGGWKVNLGFPSQRGLGLGGPLGAITFQGGFTHWGGVNPFGLISPQLLGGLGYW